MAVRVGDRFPSQVRQQQRRLMDLTPKVIPPTTNPVKLLPKAMTMSQIGRRR